ncbi:MAG: CopG family transcriptional regulator [Phycisphaeraceae bacterium]
MRTTINVDDHLFGELKQLAARTNRTLSSVIDDALRTGLAAGAKPARRGKVKLPVSRQGGGLRPGVDLDNSAAWRDLLDQRDAAA